MRTLPVPGYRQVRCYSCGFASALMIARYYRPETPALALFERLGTCWEGTTQSGIVRGLRSIGVSVNLRYDVDFARLCREIDRNKLIIGYLNDIEHWLVIYGYGRNPDRVFVADPRPYEPCEYVWASYGPRLGGYGMVCSSREARRAVAISSEEARSEERPILMPGVSVRFGSVGGPSWRAHNGIASGGIASGGLAPGGSAPGSPGAVPHVSMAMQGGAAAQGSNGGAPNGAGGQLCFDFGRREGTRRPVRAAAGAPGEPV